MNELRKLEWQDYPAGSDNLANRINELIDKVNELSKPVTTTNGQPLFGREEINRIIFAMNHLETRPLIDTLIVKKLRELKV